MKYRVKFHRRLAGWIIQQSKFGIFWLRIGNNFWRFKAGAEGAMEKIKNGEAPYWDS